MIQENIPVNIFISYNWNDREIASRIEKTLAEFGHKIIFEASTHGSIGYQKESLEKALGDYEALLVLVTASSLETANIEGELKSAMSQNKLIIPVMLRAKDIPRIFQDNRNIQLINSEDENEINRACSEINEILSDYSRNKIKDLLDSQTQKKRPIKATKQNKIHHQQSMPIEGELREHTAARGAGEDEIKQEIFQQTVESNNPSPSYWILKFNNQSFSTINLAIGAKTWMSTQVQGEFRKDYEQFRQVKPGDIILGLLQDGKGIVPLSFITIEGIHTTNEFGECISMEVVRSFTPPIPLEAFGNKLSISYELTSPSDLRLFPISKEEYQTILNAEGYNPNARKIYLPPSLTPEGNHKETEDKLQFENDYHALASVVALAEVKPPLAIGLFGKWGSGKSFFMEKMSSTIEKLSEDKSGKYVENVVQVKFNSWHYSDSNLWASLITEIFDSLNEYSKGIHKEDEIARLSESMIMSSRQKETLETQRTELEKKVGYLTEEKEKKWNKLDDLSGISTARLILNDPGIAMALPALENTQTGTPEEKKEKVDRNKKAIKATAAEVRKYIEEIQKPKTRWQQIWALIKDLKNWKWKFIALGTLALIPLIIYCWGFLTTQWQAITTTVAAVIGTIATVYKNISAARKTVNENLLAATDKLNSLKDSLNALAEPESKELDAKSMELHTLVSEIQDIDKRMSETAQKMDEIRSGKQLMNFIEQRSTDELYSRKLGIISAVRRDFEKLDDLLRKQHLISRQEKKGSSPENGNEISNPQNVTLRIDRIVLYIDDLDRCNENLVVKVLEAIHLLLAFPIFVVVVGVDPRWLNNALAKSENYKNLFTGSKSNQEEKNKNEGVASTYDYLEKIFQVPFCLKPIDKTGREALIEYLLKDEIESENDFEKNPGIEAKKNEETESSGKLDLESKLIQTTTPENQEGKMLHQQENIKGETKKEEENQVPEVPNEKLTFTPEEVAYMKKISPLFSHSPRTINRFVNIYRIIKSHKSFNVSERFSFDDFAPTMVVLGIVVGCSTEAEEFISQLKSFNGTAFSEFSSSQVMQFAQIHEKLGPYLNEEIEKLPLESFRENLDLISRFSFRTLMS